MKTITHHALGIEKKMAEAASLGAAYLISKGQVVFFTACHISDKYMKYFM